MAIEKHFIDENVKKLIIRKFTQEELSKVGCGEVDIYRTPLGMRISIHAEKPGLVIGRKGKTIQALTDTFVRDFKLENPQLEVQQIEKPELNATLMAQRIVGALERGIHFRRAVYATMKRIMGSGALGCQVTVSGKVTGERARMSKFSEGFIKHAGEQKNEYIREGYAQALLKAGVLGIKVTIVPPDANLKEITYVVQEAAELEPLAHKAKKPEPGKPEAGKSTEAKEKPAEKPGAKPGKKPEEKKPDKRPAKKEKKEAKQKKTEKKPKEKKTVKKEAEKKKASKKTQKKTAKTKREKAAEAKKAEEKKEELNTTGAKSGDNKE